MSRQSRRGERGGVLIAVGNERGRRASICASTGPGRIQEAQATTQEQDCGRLRPHEFVPLSGFRPREDERRTVAVLDHATHERFLRLAVGRVEPHAAFPGVPQAIVAVLQKVGSGGEFMSWRAAWVQVEPPERGGDVRRG